MTTQIRVKVSAIQDPSPANTVTVQKQLKESVEVAQRLRGDPADSFVRVNELTQGGLWQLVNGVLVPTGINKLGGSVVTADSVQGSGSSGSPVELVGDSASPGNSMLYGTNGSGTKGWYAQPAGGSSTLASLSDVSISSPSNGQILTYVSSASKWENVAPASSNITPDSHPASPNAINDEFEATTLDPKWTWLNQGTFTASLAGDGSSFLSSTTSASADHLRVIYQTIAAGAFDVRCKMAIDTNNTTDIRGGLYVGLPSDGKCYALGWYYNSGTPYFYCNRYTNSNTFASSFSGTGTPAPLAYGYGTPWIYLRLVYDGTNITIYVSSTGILGSYFAIATETAASFLGTAPTILGVYTDGAITSSNPKGAIFDWFRRY